MGYRIELRTKSGELVSILENVFNLSFVKQINAPEEIIFYIPSTNPKISSITLANEIWLVDSDSLEIIAKTILQTKRDTRNNTETTEIVSMGYLSRLNDELVIGYDTGSDGTTVSTILNALFDFQIQPYPITIGYVDASILAMQRSLKADGESIFSSILRLQETIGGFIEVDSNRQFNWYLDIGDDSGQQIRYGKNLIGIDRVIDYTTLKNRLYVYGAGEGETRLKLSDVVGYEEDFVEDATSQALWGGIYSSAFVDRSITHPDTLMAYAEILLNLYKNPKITYQISTIDYSYVSGIEFERFILGSIVKIIDEDLGIDISLRVIQIQRPDLIGNPELMEIQLDTLVKDITDSLNEVYDLQQFNQHIATTIGAGQVVVKGGFTVLDWASEGETTINGAQITTGSIIIGGLSDDVALMLVYSDVSPPPAPLLDGKLWLDTSDPEKPLLKRWYAAEAEWVLIAEDITDLKQTVQNLDDLMDDIFSDGMVTKDESKSLWLAFTQVKNESTNILSVALALGITIKRTNYLTSLDNLEAYLDTWVNQPEESYPIAISPAQRDNITGLFNAVQSTKTILIDEIENKKTEDAITTFENSLGEMAFEDAVEFAKLGTTIIDGGYIATGLIDASRIDTGTLNAERVSIGPLSEFAEGYDPSAITSGANVYRQTDTPVDDPPGTLEVGDIWIKTDAGDRIYTWNGTAWIQAYTTIDGGDIDTGTITANQLTVEFMDDSGVSISKNKGITIYGTDNALTTREDKTGDIQCSVSANGSFTCAGGNVKMNASGITVVGGLLELKSADEETEYDVGYLGGIRAVDVNYVILEALTEGSRLSLRSSGQITIDSYNSNIELGANVRFIGNFSQETGYSNTCGELRPNEDTLSLGTNNDPWQHLYSGTVNVATITSWNDLIVVNRHISMSNYDITCRDIDCTSIDASGSISGNSLRSRGGFVYFGTGGGSYLREYGGDLYWHKDGFDAKIKTY